MSIKSCKHLCEALYDRILQVILSKIIVMVYFRKLCLMAVKSVYGMVTDRIIEQLKINLILSLGAAVGAICGATVALAEFGLLDNRRHTSNGRGFLEMFSPAYKGQDLYVDKPMYYFSLSGATVCMRAKKDSAFPVLKYSYQNSSVAANDNYAVEYAAENGHLEVVKYLQVNMLKSFLYVIRKWNRDLTMPDRKYLDSPNGTAFSKI